jgi:hypothetical protein
MDAVDARKRCRLVLGDCSDCEKREQCDGGKDTDGDSRTNQPGSQPEGVRERKW